MPPGKKIEVQSGPLQDTGSTPVTKLDDERMELPYVEKKIAMTDVGMWPRKRGTFIGAIPARTFTV